MDELILKSFCLGTLSNNCYLVFNNRLKEGFIIDCPAPKEELDFFIQEQGLKILFIALTHGHFDHIKGLNDSHFPFYIQQEDVLFLMNAELNGSLFFSEPIEITKKPLIYAKKQSLYFEEQLIEVIPTPGHTPGSVSLKLGNWLFSGDAIFLNSIGRTDIPLASQEVLIKSIKEKIYSLSDETIIYPGHGPSTTVGWEKSNNPFVRN